MFLRAGVSGVRRRVAVMFWHAGVSGCGGLLLGATAAGRRFAGRPTAAAGRRASSGASL